MKNLLVALSVVGMSTFVNCSSDGNSSDGSSVGGTSAGGTTGIAGKSGAGGTTVNPTAVPEKNWNSTAGAAGASFGPSTDGPFGDLFADPYFDPNDPCAVAIPWITGVNTNIENGNLVQYLGKVYKYDTTNSSCNRQLTNMFDQCIPSAPADWCKSCWILQDATCP